MGELDDEFEAIIENSDMEGLHQYSSFSVEYLVRNIASCTRTVALLTELLQASFDHYTQGAPDDERPGLTADQVEILMSLFNLVEQFNESIIGLQEDDES